ncbi:DUF4920 domain-containing protein [Glaciecola petra]|uniref:DUF4920 domain-containing protein n=1 Tax=Glaciecola petra TaxID=3075602 RepID=A0ABU2ZVU4_9ALTE|nr:DUF4920 domain-containing protein [Aestuariibacter sp. P117]MDT0596153.1 DUF4920 domain-containing protein [Aestuariibacter sp. P117]
MIQNNKVNYSLHILCVSLLLMLSAKLFAQDEVIRLSEPVEKTLTTETFGEPFNNELDNIEFTSLISEPAKYVGKTIQTETEISKVCQKKGCFFIAQHDQSIMRVSFKDYGFFIPTDSYNKRVQLNGNVIEKQRSEEQATHFKQDLGKGTDAIKSGLVYEFVAESVRIKAD